MGISSKNKLAWENAHFYGIIVLGSFTKVYLLAYTLFMYP